MRQIVTTGIVLTRIDYGEADRILTILTPDHGKIRVMAKGVRKVKSKLAGGIELFSISQITFIPGRKDISTLVSTRLKTHFGAIVQDLDRTMLGYELLKRTNKITEDEPGSEYYDLLSTALKSLNAKILPALVETWFDARLLKLGGLEPNLSDGGQQRLVEVAHYIFDFESMHFVPHDSGRFTPAHIKFVRLIFNASAPDKLQNIENYTAYVPEVQTLVTTLRRQALG